MKKSFIISILLFFFVFSSNVNAKVYEETEIEDYSILVGTYLYTESEEPTTGWTGRMNTKFAMLGASSIKNANSVEEMILYYKYDDGDWVEFFTDESLTVPKELEITHINGVCVDPSCSGNSINIKFKFNDTVTSDKDVSLNYGEVISNDLVPATSSRTGYEFACWTLEGENECFDFSTKVTEDIVLEAKWNLFTYTITFKDDVHSLSKTVEPCSFAAGNECSFLDYKDVFSAVPEGYTFVGWSLAPSGEKVYSKANYKELFSNNENITLYAIFNSGTYTVAYDLNGGTFGIAVSPVTEYDPANLTYALFEPSRIGYTFNGWSLDTSSTATVVINNQTKEFTITKLGDVVLKANWTPITYTLVYNQTTLASCTYDVICDIDTSLIEIADGKELTKLEVVINEKKYEIGNKVKNLVIKSDAYEVVPTIEDIKYNVSYNLNGGILAKDNEKSLVVGAHIYLNDPSKDGYEFKGWNVTSGNATISGNKLTLNGAADVKVSAKWQANTYKLAYNGTDYATCTYDKECELKKMNSPVGYTFDGWRLKKTSDLLGDNVYNLTSEVETLEIDPILTANTYSVTYDLAGGIITEINPSKYVYGDQSLELAQPTRVGYIFAGWESDNDLVVASSSAANVSGATGDVKLTATWNAKKYKITFDGVGVSALPQECIYDQECKVKKYTPENGDLVFAGWEYNGYIYQSEEVINLDVNGEITFVAKWVNDDKYEITYNLNRGHFLSEPVRMYIIGDSINLPTPYRDGYDFDGWYTDETLENKVDGSVLDTDKANIKLYAGWTPITYKLVYNNIELASCTYAQDCSFETDKFIVPEGHELTKIYATIDNVKYEIGTKVKNLAIKNSNIEVTIDTEELGFDIVYDLDGGKVSTDNPSKITYMTEKILVEPSKTGYLFKGWDVVVGNAEVTNTTVKLTNVEDIKLKAIWEAKKYTLVYDDVTYADCTYDKECTVKDLEEAKWPVGKMFAYWTYNSDKLGKKVTNLTSVTDDVLNITPVFEDYVVLITYDYLGGSVNGTNPDRVVYQDEKTLVEPTKVGYQFNGWVVQSGDAELDGNNISVTGVEDIKLSVLWKANTYEVKYDGKVYGTCTYDKDCTIEALEEAKWPVGKTFAYWSYKGNKLGDKVVNLTNINNDTIELTPNFKDIEYSISYDLAGGVVTSNNPDRITNGEEKVLVEPTKDGYQFNGWEVVSGDATITDTSIKLNTNDNVSLKAKWIANTYTLVYSGKTYATCTYDEECTLADLAEEDWDEGKKFINWMYNGNDLGDVVYNLTSEVKSLDIEPKYENITYYILYNYDGGVVSTSNVATYNVESSTITLNEPTKFGYEFVNWRIDDEGSKATLVENTLNINSNVGNINITALYSINTYNVTYDLDGGLPAIDSHTCTVNSCTISDVVPTKENYDFVGWIDSNNGYIYEVGSSISVTSDVTLKAKWSSKNKNSYKINYHLNGGSFIDEEGNEVAPNISYLEGEAPILTDAEKQGYTFDGWLVDNDGEPTKTLEAGLNKDLELYAKFTANTYKVTYAVGDYLDEDVIEEYIYDSEYTLNNYVSEFEAKGYKLLGWELSLGSGLYYGNGLAFKNLEGGLTDVTLYPVVEVIKDDYIISYYLDGGSFVKPAEVMYSYNDGEAITLPEVIKNDYVLDGWKLSDGTVINSITEYDSADGNIVLIPIWVSKSYTLTYISTTSSGTDTKTKTCYFDTDCLIDYSLDVDGYKFVGWKFTGPGEMGSVIYPFESFFNISEEIYNELSMNSIVLYAVWEAETYSIEYTDNDGNLIDFASYGYSFPETYTADEYFVVLSGLGDFMDNNSYGFNRFRSADGEKMFFVGDDVVFRPISGNKTIIGYQNYDPITSTGPYYINLYYSDNSEIGQFAVNPNTLLNTADSYTDGEIPKVDGVDFTEYNWYLGNTLIDLDNFVLYDSINLYLDPSEDLSVFGIDEIK